MKLSTYIKLQKFLLTAFFASIAILTLSSFFSMNSEVTNANVIKTNSPLPTPFSNINGVVTANNNSSVDVNNNSAANSSAKPNDEGGYGWVILGGVSFITSLTSLLGFISTTVLAWRKEKRDVEIIRYDNEKKELELEKLKWELEKLKAAEAEKEPKPKRRKPKPTD
jgi:hypothetical protein